MYISHSVMEGQRHNKAGVA